MAAPQVYGTSASKCLLLAKRKLFLKQGFWVANNKPSRDQQGQASTMLRVHHRWQFNSPKDPQSASSGGIEPTGLDTPRAIPWCACASAASKGCPYQALARPQRICDGTHADTNKAEAAPIKSRTLGMSVKDCRSWETFVPTKLRNGKQEITCKKHDFSQCLQALSLACPQWTVLRNESKQTIPL